MCKRCLLQNERHPTLQECTGNALLVATYCCQRGLFVVNEDQLIVFQRPAANVRQLIDAVLRLDGIERVLPCGREGQNTLPLSGVALVIGDPVPGKGLRYGVGGLGHRWGWQLTQQDQCNGRQARGKAFHKVFHWSIRLQTLRCKRAHRVWPIARVGRLEEAINGAIETCHRASAVVFGQGFSGRIGSSMWRLRHPHRRLSTGCWPLRFPRSDPA